LKPAHEIGAIGFGGMIQIMTIFLCFKALFLARGVN